MTDREYDIENLSERLLDSIYNNGTEDGMARALLQLIGPTDEEYATAVEKIYARRPDLKRHFDPSSE